MGLITDYFIAGSDTEAARFLDGGVHGAGLDEDDLHAAKGIDPFVMLGTLETALTELPYAEISGDRTPPVGMGASDGSGIVRVRGTLTAALADLDPGRVPEVAESWGSTEEFGPDADKEAVADFLRGMKGLARRAVAQGRAMYCWFSV
ncbi:hypothetical protein [Promicromonospora kroppenstedtii]|uniref:hypothetical protein n=1 Tax=Promicromonospora kroppenstedtii TaxID=440482 RepID=UPI000688406B|nr:hypothetical protein [Promicromonospora kroppenstedtii]